MGVAMRFVVTAGPTREFIDPVRFLSNPSTGRMGFAVASAAIAAGHEVTLVAGPVALHTPSGAVRIDVVSAREMLAAVKTAMVGADAMVMTAAVADWRPARCAARKLKKGEMSGTLQLVRNPDILKTLSRLYGSAHPGRKGHRPVMVGFAAETGAPDSEAVRKCREKGLDIVVGNDVLSPGSGFGVATNRVTFATPDGHVQHLPLMGKLAVARRIVRFVEETARRRRG